MSDAGGQRVRATGLALAVSAILLVFADCTLAQLPSESAWPPRRMERLPPVTETTDAAYAASPGAAMHAWGPSPAWIDLAGRPWWVDAEGFAYSQAWRDGRLVRVYRVPFLHAIVRWIERWSIFHRIKDTDWEAAVQRGVRDAVVEGFNDAGQTH